MASDVKSDRAKLRRHIATSAKSFDASLFDQHDREVREKVLAHIRLTQPQTYIRDNVDKFGPDLVVYTGFSPSSYIEVEVKKVWQGPTFPYETVQLPERKEKYSKLKLPCQYWILNSTMEYAIVIDSSKLASCSKVEVPNRYVKSGEYFFQVPIAQCKVIKLGELTNGSENTEET